MELEDQFQLKVQKELDQVKQQYEHQQGELSLIEQRKKVCNDELNKLCIKISDLSFQRDELVREKWLKEHPIALDDVKVFSRKDDLYNYPLRFIDQIVKQKYGCEKLTFYDSLGSESCRHPVSKLSPAQYREAVIDRLHLRSEHCTYCHSVYHDITACAMVKKLHCDMCGHDGHTKMYCHMRVCDLYKK